MDYLQRIRSACAILPEPSTWQPSDWGDGLLEAGTALARLIRGFPVRSRAGRRSQPCCVEHAQDETKCLDYAQLVERISAKPSNIVCVLQLVRRSRIGFSWKQVPTTCDEDRKTQHQVGRVSLSIRMSPAWALHTLTSPQP